MSNFSARVRRGVAGIKQRCMPIRRPVGRDGRKLSTEDLIDVLVADLRSSNITPLSAPRLALVIAIMLVIALFAAIYGPRSDFWTTAMTSRFLFEIVVTGTFAVSTFLSPQICAYPDSDGRTPWRALLPGTIPLVSGVSFELLFVQPDDWIAQTIGQSAALCVTGIVLMGLLPLVAFIAALRHGAPIRPGSAGMLAGVLSGAIAATFYAVHSSEDSPLFFAAWYSLAIGLLALIGAVAGRLLLRW